MPLSVAVVAKEMLRDVPDIIKDRRLTK
jgi:hypothetical protein